MKKPILDWKKTLTGSYQVTCAGTVLIVIPIIHEKYAMWQILGRQAFYSDLDDARLDAEADLRTTAQAQVAALTRRRK